MNDGILDELLRACRERRPCALVTVAAVRGSVPREAGSKMLVYGDGRISGTIGGGKFESLVIEASLAALKDKQPVLKSYPLREGEPDSFGAICGGEVTMLIEPQVIKESVCLVGAGHCSRAIARVARDCGLHVTVIDSRAELMTDFEEAHVKISDRSAPDFISSRQWQQNDALVLVSPNYQGDEDALRAALAQPAIGYIGMIGSRRKVLQVFDHLKAKGISEDGLQRVYAPIGLDIGADSPAEIAVSVVAEILQVLRRRKGGHLAITRQTR
jgi:xanthine dehydrogenase accessory factor